MLRNKKAQSTLEYVIVFTVVLAAILLAGPAIRSSVQNLLTHAASQAETAVQRIQF